LTNWSNAGAASVLGTNYVVTNSAFLNERYYRLHKL
jgi:hypothetical protein